MVDGADESSAVVGNEPECVEGLLRGGAVIVVAAAKARRRDIGVDPNQAYRQLVGPAEVGRGVVDIPRQNLSGPFVGQQRAVAALGKRQLVRCAAIASNGGETRLQGPGAFGGNVQDRA
jgi:hypothetical protein